MILDSDLLFVYIGLLFVLDTWDSMFWIWRFPICFSQKKLSTRTRPRKVPTATTYFPVVATRGGWDLGNLRPDLGSYHDSKTFGLFRLPMSHQNFRVLKCTMAHAPSTYNRPIRACLPKKRPNVDTGAATPSVNESTCGFR